MRNGLNSGRKVKCYKKLRIKRFFKTGDKYLLGSREGVSVRLK